MLRRLAFAVGSTSLLASSIAHALGLGDIKLSSHLNQPLQAEIQLVALRGESAGSIHATLARNEEFEKAGLERAYALNDIKFEVVEVSDGQAVIRVRTKEPVREPFLSFIVELNWPNGRLLREYTVLLDPPLLAAEPIVTEQLRPARPAATTGTVQRAEPATDAAPGAVTASGDMYTVQATDTLWSIASRSRPSNDLTVHQTVAAIYRANPQAFADNDPNRIRAGAVLQLPTAEEIARVPHRRALSDMLRNEAVLDTSRPAAAAPRSSAGNGARLSVVAPPEEYKKPASRSSAVSREAAEVLNQENEALRGELSRLVERTEKLEQLVKLKDEQLAALQGGTPAGSTDVAAETPSSVPDSGAGADTGGTPETAGGESPAPAETAAAKPAKPVKAAEPAAEPSLVDSLMSGDTPLYLGGGLLAVLLLAGGMIWHRRRVANEDFQHAYAPVDRDEPESMPRLDDELDLPEVGEEILTPPTPAAGSPVTRSGELVADPLGEADIYIAYGKFEQAEQLLLTAIDAEPARAELQLKLLECYAEMHDAARFHDRVNQMRDLIDARPDVADEVARLEKRAFAADAGGAGATSMPSADDIFGSMAVGSAAAPTAEFTLPDDSSDEGWKRPETVRSEPTPIAAAGDEFHFNLDETIEGGLPSAPEEGTRLPSVADDDGMHDDFNFNLDEQPAEPAAAASSWSMSDEPTPSRASARDELDFSDMGLDHDGHGGDADGLGGDIDEMATKLDLARAYIEMLEVEGAREILNEVIAEGNEQQRQEAEALLARL